jgi:hypothetical protein
MDGVLVNWFLVPMSLPLLLLGRAIERRQKTHLHLLQSPTRQFMSSSYKFTLLLYLSIKDTVITQN